MSEDVSALLSVLPDSPCSLWDEVEASRRGGPGQSCRETRWDVGTRVGQGVSASPPLLSIWAIHTHLCLLPQLRKLWISLGPARGSGGS